MESPEPMKRNKFELVIKGGKTLLHEGFNGFILLYRRNREKIRNSNQKNSFQEPKIDLSFLNEQIPYYEDIRFPPGPDSVEISVIIPVHDNLNFSIHCLRNLSQEIKKQYEIIVVDDASTGDTQKIIPKISGVHYIRNDEKIGVPGSFNKGAASCRGKFILFLMNYCLLADNSLDNLEELAEKKHVGAISSKLIYPYGNLLDAGGVAWDDGILGIRGTGDNPEKPEYNFVREVDYSSGDVLFIKKEIFEKIGGFNEDFKTLNWSSLDLCFSIRKLGNKLLYDPKFKTIQLKELMLNSDDNEGNEENQKTDSKRFKTKWAAVLNPDYYVDDSGSKLALKPRLMAKNILIIDRYVPTFDKDGGSYRMYNILKILVDLGFNVTFVGNDFNRREPYDSILQRDGVEVLYSPFITSVESYLSESGHRFSVVIVSRPDYMMKYEPAIRKHCINAKIIYDTVDLSFIRESRKAELYNDPVLKQKAGLLKRLELDLARKSDRTLVVSEDEKIILKKEIPSVNVQVLSFVYELNPVKKNFDDRSDIIFLGSFAHDPNEDGVFWFVKEIYPRIKKEIPDIKLFIVGDRPTRKILSVLSNDIIVTGFVEDVGDLFDRCRIFIAPLRYGAGVKAKVCHSMSYGLPVVTTTIGAEGLGLTDGYNILIGDDAATFSEKVLQIYKDKELWNNISKHSLEHIENHYSYEAGKQRVMEIIDGL
jgi:O-antigen biosynthesis protein